jgi:ribosomal protein L29
MKKDEKTTLFSKSVSELQTQLQETQRELAVTRLAVRANKQADISKPKRLGQVISIIKTILKEKQIHPDVVQSPSGEKGKKA